MARECVTHHYACDCREAAHAARLAELEQSLAEQARLNGMGSEREAALLARCEAAERRASDFQRKLAVLSDMMFGTPCAEVRWNQERERLEADAKRIDFLERMFFGIKVRNGRRYDAGPGNARYIIDAAAAYRDAAIAREGEKS